LLAYLQTDSGKQELADLGFELGNMFVFDGLPQYFPTETAAYRSELNQYHSEENFLQNNGYSGWHTEFGSSCRGPLPSNSPLKEVATNIRQDWMDQGFDMRWYGRTWEFANMFWFQTKMCKLPEACVLALDTPFLRGYLSVCESYNRCCYFLLTRSGKGKDGQLDCTHSVEGQVRGSYAVHKFFVQAMLDDYFETMHAS
jgi:hypothetical protein